MTYRLVFSDAALNDLGRLDKQLRRRVVDKLAALAEQGETANHRALTGPWKGLFPIRVGE